jgi:hypothetical protein
MRAAVRVIAAAISIGVASGRSASAQKAQEAAPALPPTSSPVICDNHALTPPSYVPCALWFDRGRLRRGASGDELARAGGFFPIQLTELVRGDSAIHYASHYQDYTLTASALRLVGLNVMAFAAAKGGAPGCRWPVCAIGRTHTSRVIGWSGLSVFVLSLPFGSMATQAASRAVWWHNAGLGR